MKEITVALGFSAGGVGEACYITAGACAWLESVGTGSYSFYGEWIWKAYLLVVLEVVELR
jgi:hypothetical protein